MTKKGLGFVNPNLKMNATKLKMKMAESTKELAKIANKNPFYCEII